MTFFCCPSLCFYAISWYGVSSCISQYIAPWVFWAQPTHYWVNSSLSIAGDHGQWANNAVSLFGRKCWLTTSLCCTYWLYSSRMLSFSFLGSWMKLTQWCRSVLNLWTRDSTSFPCVTKWNQSTLLQPTYAEMKSISCSQCKKNHIYHSAKRESSVAFHWGVQTINPQNQF